MSKNTPKQLESLNWGMIGCGNVTDVKSAPCYQKVPGFNLVGVTNRTLSKAQTFATQNNIEHIFENAKALVESKHIDAVYIATPPDSHLEYASLVASVGKPCCIEKPLAPSYAESEAILKAFQGSQTPLFVAYYRRSLPRFEKVKLWLEQKVIGDIRHIQWNYCRPPSESDLAKVANWRTDKNVAYGGYFDDLASHGLNLFEFLLGEISDAHGTVANQQKLYSACDSIAGVWLHENNITGTGFWNFASHLYRDEVEILGSDGELRFSVFEDQPVRYSNRSTSEEIFIANPENVQIHHVENMRRHLNGSAYHPSTGESGVKTAWVMDKILGKIV